MQTLSSQKSESWLSWFLRGLLVICFLTLMGKLIEIQIIKGGYYRALAEENRIRHIPIPAPRGEILARGGEVLVGNVEIKKRIKFGPGGSYELSEDLTNASADEMVTDYKRNYALGDKFAHASGYLGLPGADMIGKVNPDCPEKGPLASDSLIGKTGLEQEYQCELEGIPGEELIEVNTAGKKIRTLGTRDPIPGQNLRTTIDFGLQTEVANDMVGKKGAATVTDTTGQILAFYSSPSFDPNLFNQKSATTNLSSLFTNPDLLFFNRVISGTFHPGSVFKPIVAIAALEEKSIDSNFVFNDTGVITINGFSYTNWYFTEFGRTEGLIGLTKAIARSTDTFFYKIGEMVGPEAIARWADTFGLNKISGVDIPGETSGLIPTPDWKRQKIGESWFLGDTYHMAIGQGYVAISPIEENTYISAIAANGSICTPHFDLNRSASCIKISLTQSNLDLVKDGMKSACQTGGTAYTFFDFSQKHNGQTVACKTGTAEVSADGTPHAWFVFFTPIENPQIVATILVEHGGQGADVAGPIARKIADYYFQSELSK